MRRLMDTIAAVILVAIALHLLIGLLVPYVPYIVLALIVFLIGGLTLRKWRSW